MNKAMNVYLMHILYGILIKTCYKAVELILGHIIILIKGQVTVNKNPERFNCRGWHKPKVKLQILIVEVVSGAKLY